MTLHPLSPPLSRLFTWGQRWSRPLLASMFGSSAGAPAPSPDRAGTGPAGPADDCRAAMRQVLESQVIPRLLQATRPAATLSGPSDLHPTAGPAANDTTVATRRPLASVAATPISAPAPASVAPSQDDVESFASVCAQGDRAACHQHAERLQAAGLHAEAVLTELVAPAARHLGQRWEDDTLDFASVTVGLVLMHELVHALGYGVHDGPLVGGQVRRVMLASAPGSQHMLGLSIVSEFFRKAGWQVVLEVSPSRTELCRAVANEWFDLIGLSVGVDTQLAELPALVQQLRTASRSPMPPVLLGGPVFLQRDLAAEAFGAQAICRDARESLGIASALVDR
jgi:methanogenic corrinoid protein MtbC1